MILLEFPSFAWISFIRRRDGRVRVRWRARIFFSKVLFCLSYVVMKHFEEKCNLWFCLSFRRSYEFPSFAVEMDVCAIDGGREIFFPKFIFCLSYVVMKHLEKKCNSWFCLSFRPSGEFPSFAVAMDVCAIDGGREFFFPKFIFCLSYVVMKHFEKKCNLWFCLSFRRSCEFPSFAVAMDVCAIDGGREIFFQKFIFCLSYVVRRHFEKKCNSCFLAISPDQLIAFHRSRESLVSISFVHRSCDCSCDFLSHAIFLLLLTFS